MKILFILLLISFVFTGYCADTLLSPDKYIEKITNIEIDEKDKIGWTNLFIKNGLMLDENNARKLLEYLPKVKEKKLLFDLLRLIEGYSEFSISMESINKYFYPVLDKYLDDEETFDHIYFYATTLYRRDGDFSVGNDFSMSHSLRFKYIQKSDKLLEYYLSKDEIDPCMPDYPEGVRYPEYFLNKISPSNTDNLNTLLIKFVNSRTNGIISFVQMENIKNIVTLLNSKNADIKNGVEYLLKTVTHQHKISDWNKWSIENAKISLFKEALKALIDKTIIKEERLIAADQIFDSVTYYGADTKLAIGSLMLPLTDTADDIYLRAQCYRKLLTIVQNKNYNYQEIADLVSAIDKMLDDSRFHELILCSLDKNILNDKTMWRKAFKILTQKDFNSRSKGFALFALRLSNVKRKQIANLALQYLKDMQHKQDVERSKFFAIATLTELTGSQCENDIIGWEKAVSSMPDDPPESAEEKK